MIVPRNRVRPLNSREKQVIRLRRAYAENHIPWDDALNNLPEPMAASMADHWELRAKQAEDESEDPEDVPVAQLETPNAIVHRLRRLSGFVRTPHDQRIGVHGKPPTVFGARGALFPLDSPCGDGGMLS